MLRDRRAAVLGMLVVLGACQQDAPQPTAVAGGARAAVGAAPPAELVTVSHGGESVTFRPYTGTDFGDHRSDPINLAFVGPGDALSIRAALFALDGNRAPMLPPVFPFDCTWKDAIGEEQTGYSTADGWEGSVVQLECGDYAPVRFHLRLFSAGGWTIANAHLDVLIPGTPNHQVLAWELAEQLVVVDFVRSGLLAEPPSPTQPIHEAPFRSIPAIIYNNLPPGLQQLAWDPTGANPAPPEVVQPVPILTDGRATILRLGDAPSPSAGAAIQSFVIEFDQVIPKPFCNPGNAFVLVRGPVELTQDVRVTPSGNLQRSFSARGELDVTPVNPITGHPIGPTQRARVQDLTQAHLNRQVRQLHYSRRQQLETAGPPEQLREDLQVGPNRVTRFDRNERCTP